MERTSCVCKVTVRDQGAQADTTTLSIELQGQKSSWGPKLREQLVRVMGEAVRDYLDEILDALPDAYVNQVNMVLTFDEVVVPANAITTLEDIPRVLEGLDQPAIRLSSAVGGKHRDLVLLGETHLATEQESQAAARVIPYFDAVGLEGIQLEGFPEGKFFFAAISWVMRGLVWLTYLGRRSRQHDSSITQGNRFALSRKQRKLVVHLERGWKPQLRTRIFFLSFPVTIYLWVYAIGKEGVDAAASEESGSFMSYLALTFCGVVVIPFIIRRIWVLRWLVEQSVRLVLDVLGGIGALREAVMVENIMRTLEENPHVSNMVVLTGRAHTKPLAKRLTREHGWKEKSFR